MNRLQQVSGHLTNSMTGCNDKDSSIFFGQDTVNRVSFLREDADFIELALREGSSKILVMSNGAPAGTVEGAELIYATFKDFEELLNTWIVNNRRGVAADEVRVAFLGIDESQDGIKYKQYSGLAFFAVDLTTNEHALNEFLKAKEATLYKDRGTIFHLGNFDASMMSHGKMYLDWMNRIRFCAGCGSKTLAIHAGTKMLCSSTDDQNCPVKTATVSNVSFPRTDPVVISAIVTRDHSKVLLGRGKRFPGNMYSCIAGFLEPSETIEVASMREAWEETGVRGTEVQIIKSQPWPYPANLMIGCVIYVDPNGVNEVIHLGHDPELADAKWFSIEEIKHLENGGTADWTLPPKQAIARSLIQYVIEQHSKATK